jgi:cobalt-zinc-cadmium efflux system outer membrane protein
MRILLLVFCAAVTAAGTTPLIAQDTLGREPVSLLQVLDSVAARYPSLEAARARIRAARGSRSTAGTLGNPILMYQVENAPFPGRSAPPMDREMMLTATLPLEPLYQRWSRVSGANAEIRAAEADAQAERQRIGLDATHAFYRMARAQVALAAARDLAAWLDSVVAYNRTRVKEGVAAEADLIRSELERDRAEADATMQEADLARARPDLTVFLGDEPAPPSFLVAALDAPLALPDVSLTSRAGTRRPDIRAARERVSAAGAGVTTERTSIIRQLGLTVGTKRSAGTTSLIAGVSMPFPLFDQNRGAITRAAAEREATAFELAAQERIARAEIVGAAESARLLTDRARVLAGAARGQGYLARADEARRIALGAYREGAVPLIQVIDAARAWGEAQLVYYQILYAQHESVVQLLVAEGVDVASALPALTIGAEARP